MKAVRHQAGADRLIQVEKIVKYFPLRKKILGKDPGKVKAVDGISFHINRGETLGLLGESGCGKTTVGRLLMRLIEPTAGKIYFEGINITRLNHGEMQKMRRNMQLIFQDPFGSLNPRKTVRSIIGEPLKIHRITSKNEEDSAVEKLMDVVGLNKSFANRYPHEFSGGQRQRIGIARALALNPKLIICDEPVSALDVSIQAQVVNLLQDLQRDFNLTYLFISHDLSVVKHISDRVAVMYLGKMVELANKHDIYANPKHPYTQALLSAVPVPDPTRRRSRFLLRGDVPSPIDPPSGCRFHTRCPHTMNICSQEEPAVKNVGMGHLVSCHLYSGDH